MTIFLLLMMLIVRASNIPETTRREQSGGN